MKKLVAMILALTLCLAFVACGSQSGPAKDFQVGVCQLMKHDALDAATQGFQDALTVSLLPKSVTSAIGVALSEQAGGIGALTTAVIIITGIFGNILGPWFAKVFRLRDPISQGVAFGTAAHVIGTSRAMELSPLIGAVSSLSLTLAGLITTALLFFVFM